MDTTRPRKRRRDAAIAVSCEVCGTETTEPRRGLCIRCYRRLQRGSPALEGACEVCGLTDQRLLRAVRSGTEVLCLCHNCGWLAERYGPKPLELDVLRSFIVPPGNRRKSLDRRRAERRRVQRRKAIEDRRRQPRLIDKGDRRLNLDRRSSSAGR